MQKRNKQLLQKQLFPKCIQKHRDTGTVCVKSYGVKNNNNKKKSIF